jgi:hypothetical protein
MVVFIAGCGSGVVTRVTAPSAARLARWSAFARSNQPIDLVGPRRDGSLVLAAATRLWLLAPTGAIRRFAPRYRGTGGEEYIALSPGGCFGRGTVYAIRLSSPRGVVRISVQGVPRQLATLRAPGLINGIAFDRTGRFRHRLLVTINHGKTTTVDAISCRGAVHTITSTGPRVEGGIAVAPASFGRFAGDLIAPDELGGGMFAVTPRGTSTLLVRSGLPHGPDTGVESEGFVPAGRVSALVSDRLTPGNPHPGDNLVLRLGPRALHAAGVRAGDLLVATEGGALVDLIRCGRRGCQVRHIANGPPRAHVEGHIAFAP